MTNTEQFDRKEQSPPPEDLFIQERMGAYNQQLLYAAAPFPAPLRKSKAAAGILAFLLPGLGHFYLGLMQRGVVLMIMLALNIALIPYFVINHGGSNIVPVIVLLGCLIPVIYFYNIFDVLQSADKINRHAEAVRLGIADANETVSRGTDSASGGQIGLSLVILGIAFFVFSSKPAWIGKLFDLFGSYLGAVILIGAGILFFLRESRRK